MSDTPGGPDWFQAADGKWYPRQPQPDLKKRRGCLKPLLIGIGVIVVLIIIASVASGGGDDKKSTKTDGSTTTTVKKSDAKVTLDEYNKVSNGMTYQQVKDIFGGAEQSAASSSIGNQTIDTVTWSGDGFGDTVIIQFDGPKETGKVTSKSQFGLGNG